MEVATFLLGAGLLLGALALSGLLFRRFGLSAIPSFILLGVVLHPLVGESPLVEVFGAVGVTLLLFFMGLEFSFRALVRGRGAIMSHGVRDLVVNLPLGFAAGLVLGWGLLGSLVLAAAFYVTSSAILSKTVIELRRTAYPETEVALGILVFEDLVIAVLLAVLSGVVQATGGTAELLASAGRTLLFFVAVGLLARFGRGALNRLLRIEEDDLFLLVSGALLLLFSWAALASGLSEAIGAFLAGALVAETDHRERIEGLFAPLEGMFAAIFFLAFGLSIDATLFVQVWAPALLLIVLAVAGKLASAWWSGRSAGLSRRASLSLGFMLVPRGEFSIVLAALATAIGFELAPPLVALVVLVLAIIGAVATRHGPWLAARILREPPKPELEARGFRPDLAG